MNIFAYKSISFRFIKELSILRSLLYSSSFFVISARMLPIAFKIYPNAMHESTIQNEVKTSSISEFGTVPIFFIVVNAQYYAYKYVFHQVPSIIWLASAHVVESSSTFSSTLRIQFQRHATIWLSNSIYIMSLKS